jgi:hypothetical protein
MYVHGRLLAVSTKEGGLMNKSSYVLKGIIVMLFPGLIMSQMWNASLLMDIQI